MFGSHYVVWLTCKNCGFMKEVKMRKGEEIPRTATLCPHCRTKNAYYSSRSVGWNLPSFGSGDDDSDED